MTDSDRLNVSTIDYGTVYRSMEADRSEHHFAVFRRHLVQEWFRLYDEVLVSLGYKPDGCSDCYELGSFTYCCDNTQDPSLSDEWWASHREDCRNVVAHGFSSPTRERRDASRLRYFRNLIVREYGSHRNDLLFDKGHYIAHSIGGVIDNGIFAQRRDINRGHGELGRIYRAMERYAFDNPGTFLFSRPIYGDGCVCPFFVEYGLLRSDGTWWVEVFPNRYTYTKFTGIESCPQWRQESWR